jgi:hypothetical protein
LTSAAAAGQTNLACDTQYRHFYAGRQAVVVNPEDYTDYEVGTISSLTTSQITLTANLSGSFPVGFVCPMYEFRIGNRQEASFQVNGQGQITVSAMEALESVPSYSYSLPSSGANTYNSKDVFEIVPVKSFSYSYDRPGEMTQYLGLGFYEGNYDIGDDTYSSDRYLEFQLLLSRRQDIQSFLDFFDSKMGKLTTFYVPTWNDDLVPTEAIGAADTEITVSDNTYASGKHVYITYPGQSAIQREISSVGTGTITLSSAIGYAVSESDLSKLKISYMLESRFSGDKATLNIVREGASKSGVSFRAARSATA